MNIVINGNDLSAAFSPYSLDVDDKKVFGKNNGTSMGGSEIVDLVAVKAVLNLVSGLLTEGQYRKISELAKLDYVTVTYDDPGTGKSETRVMIPTRGPARQIPLLGGGYMYKNMKITLQER